MRKLFSLIIGACLVLAASCSHPGDQPSDALPTNGSTQEETASRYIFTMGQLQSVMASLSQFPTGDISCRDASLPMAIDAQRTLYEQLIAARAVFVNVGFKLTESQLKSVIPEGTAVVFSYAAGEKLCVWLIDNEGRRAFGEAQG